MLSDGRVLVAGGEVDLRNNPLSSTEIYDLATGRWSPTGSMSRPRQNHTATLLSDGKVLVAGGWDDDEQTSTAEVYDSGTGRWLPTEE
jgi:hypothetical protein